MSTQFNSNNPTSYFGVGPTNPGQNYFRSRDPIAAIDVHNYRPGDRWINTVGNIVWELVKIQNQPAPLGPLAIWVQTTGTGGGVASLTGNDLVPVGPTGGNIDALGDTAQGIYTSSIGASTMSITAFDATTASKGVAQFDPAFFTVVGGVVTPILTPMYMDWSPIIGVGPETLDENTGRWTTNPGLTTLVLPVTQAAGTVSAIQGFGAGGWTLTQNANQQIFFTFLSSTTLGVGGSVSSFDAFDGIVLLCVVADLVWVALSVKGNPTIV